MLISVSHSLSLPPETTMARGQKYQRGRIRHNIKHSGYFSCHSLSRCASCYRSEFWTISRPFLLLLIKFHPKARFLSYFAPLQIDFHFESSAPSVSAPWLMFVQHIWRIGKNIDESFVQMCACERVCGCVWKIEGWISSKVAFSFWQSDSCRALIWWNYWNVLKYKHEENFWGSWCWKSCRCRWDAK